jgi:hypothetical protein
MEAPKAFDEVILKLKEKGIKKKLRYKKKKL